MNQINKTNQINQKMRTQLVKLVLLFILATGFVLAKASGTVAAVEPNPDTLMTQGLQAYQRGSFDQALAAWKQAAQL